MFYVIALAGAYKRVIGQLRDQLVMVGLLKSTCIDLLSYVYSYWSYLFIPTQTVICMLYCFPGGS